MKHSFLLMYFLPVICAASLSAQQPAADARTNYAVVNLKPGDGVSDGESELISDRLRTELFKTGKVNMMERNQMQDILKEQGFQQSGVCTDEACLVEMGQMLGVKIMVIGSLGKLGSMFMVNIRAIDVQTAQIVKVVSVDVKGDIEEVVDHLAEIARKITGGETAAPPPEEPQPAVEETVREPVDEQPQKTEVSAEEEKQPPVAAEPDNDDKENVYEPPEKNRNRHGVGFTFNLSALPSHYVDEVTDYEEIKVLDVNTGYYIIIDEYDFERDATPVMDFLIRFYIRMGKYLNLEVGPHYTTASETYTYAYSDFLAKRLQLTYSDPAEFEIEYYIPGVHIGLDFVKRFHPLKINVGIFGDISIPIVYYSYDGINPLTLDYLSEEETAVQFNFIPGIRAGAEFLVGQHLGLGGDFIFQMQRMDLDYDFDEYDLDLYDYEATMYAQEVLFPMIGFGFSVNIYF